MTRFPAEVRDELMKVAAAADRSLSAEVWHRVKQTLSKGATGEATA